MKNSLLIVLSVSFLWMGCTEKKLDQKTAQEMIVSELQFPIIGDYDIFCNDPQHAKRLIDLGLEKQGLVTVKRTRKILDPNPLLFFTDKAALFLLETSSKDKSSSIQKVKVWEERFGQISSVITNTTKNVTIFDYTVVRENTVFAVLYGRDLKKEMQCTAYFYLSENGWEIVNRADVEFGKFQK
ncbi:hypothetical protein [Flavobacterium sp. TAB 87]|uniref:hypothetical protein n=1 Tax=Flavobacterium sp. TAB 87 TaxID=1729581 RepID=UPI00076D6BF0|nr:hypothetical protein [Flavobacterium sp. TAB 87]KVV16212.1 hypothetical protein AP058_00270 [Flavobacterium sp. TAB 87]